MNYGDVGSYSIEPTNRTVDFSHIALPSRSTELYVRTCALICEINDEGQIYRF